MTEEMAKYGYNTCHVHQESNDYTVLDEAKDEFDAFIPVGQKIWSLNFPPYGGWIGTEFTVCDACKTNIIEGKWAKPSKEAVRG